MDEEDEKRAALRVHHGLNPHPEAVTDPLFVGDDPFFDARDLVQVKYEMLRRVQRDGASVTSAAQAFGLSRPAFYAAQRAWEQGGLPALVPARPGPRRAHKLREEVVTYLPATLKTWRRAGLVRAHPYNERPDYLFEPPGPSTPAKGAWKFAPRPTPTAVNE